MARKILLDFKYEPEFHLIGLFSSLKNYKLAWDLNKQLGLDLRMLPSFSWQSLECPLYRYENPERRLEVFLLGNRIINQNLFPEPKNMDYVMLLRNTGPHIDVPRMVADLRKIRNLQLALWLKPLQKKTLDLLFDLELLLENFNKPGPFQGTAC
jgi:hypothetical protein